MTIKGSLQMSIAIVKTFLTRNFVYSNICVFLEKWGRNVKFLFSGPPKGTSLRETTSFDVFIMKIGAGVLAVGSRKNQKQEIHQEMR